MVSDEQIVKLYLLRWNIETDFRSHKCALNAGILSCRTPEMVRKELSVHLLVYKKTEIKAVAGLAAINGAQLRSQI